MFSICNSIFSQCDVNDILPFKTGKTKFQNQSIENLLNYKLDKSKYEDDLTPDERIQKMSTEERQALQGLPKEQQNQFFDGIKKSYEHQQKLHLNANEEWEKPGYLKNDSIHVVHRYLIVPSNWCLHGRNPKMLLNFADDTLFLICLTLNYAPEEFDALQSDYNSLINQMRSKKGYFAKEENTILSIGGKPYQQYGEGYSFSTYDESKEFRTKIDRYTIEFNKWNDGDDYTLMIKYVNTKHTKYKNYEYYFNRAILRANQKNYKGSISDLDKFIGLNPKDGNAYIARGNIKTYIQDINGACLDWQKAIELGYGFREVYDLIKKYCN